LAAVLSACWYFQRWAYDRDIRFATVQSFPLRARLEHGSMSAFEIAGLDEMMARSARRIAAGH
jgi:hypothetical protein